MGNLEVREITPHTWVTEVHFPENIHSIMTVFKSQKNQKKKKKSE